MPKFSIVIPVYNAEMYLRECLDSVLAQSITDWECVCVDDGCRDNSGQILEEYASRDKRFKIIHQENGGEAVARNVGLDHALGEWITWLDADDAYAPNRLEEALRIAEAEDPDIIRFKTYQGGPGEGVPRQIATENRNYCVLKNAAAQDWAWNQLVPAGMVWTWVAKRQLIEGIRFVPGMRVKTDCIYSCELALRVVNAVQSSYTAYFYRYLEGSAIHSKRTVSDTLRMLDAAMNLFSRPGELDSSIKDVQLGARRLRMECECEIIDWVLANPQSVGLAKIYEKYLELKRVGLFRVKSIQQLRYRLPMWWFDLTGQVWMIRLVDKIVEYVRAVKK